MTEDRQTCHAPRSPAARAALALLFAALVLAGCAAAMMRTPSPDIARNQDLDGYPYSPLVYHLDLSVLAYQLYAQTLIWPFDPFYEAFAGLDNDRNRVMQNVRAWARATGARQVRTPPKLGGYRGPGLLAGFADNPRSDPIIHRYDQLFPWRPAIFNPADRWTEYTSPNAITGAMRDVYMCYRRTGRPQGDVAVEHVTSDQGAARPGARDVLLAFEGSTGDKGEPGQVASQSLLGFVLMRYLSGSDDYDLHITFRGSRSGSALRAAVKANFTTSASGNPDWVTDLGWYRIGAGEGASVISTTGKVHRGFATAMAQSLPQIFACLDRGARLARGRPPRTIFVTGHSLGGGLAQHFVSAVLLGDRYGPGGAGPAMPARLGAWPWTNLKLISFSAPTAGDELWAGVLTEEALQSEAFNTRIEPIDLTALAVHDPSILPRLAETGRPADYRVLISTDPITTEKVNQGKHVGKTIYANKLGPLAPFAVAKLKSHEPEHIRNLLTATLDDPRIPPGPVRYRAMAAFNPGHVPGAQGTIAEFSKLRIAIEDFAATTGLPYDPARPRQDFDIFTSFVGPG